MAALSFCRACGVTVVATVGNLTLYLSPIISASCLTLALCTDSTGLCTFSVKSSVLSSCGAALTPPAGGSGLSARERGAAQCRPPACLFSVTVTIIVYRHRNGKDTMKDAHDNLTSDLLPVQRPRGRPRTGKAKTQAERQAAYRARVQAEYLTVRLPKGLVQGLKDAQMKAVRNGSALVALTPLQAGELLKAIRVSERSQQG